jgi:predicted ATP-binding protein involved in virulence
MKKIEIKNHTYFHSIDIEEINCFKDKQTLNLFDDQGNYSPWTIILGDNGTGKTTLLKILDRMQPESNEVDFTKINKEFTIKAFLPKFYLGGLNPNYIESILTDLKQNNTIIRLNIINNKAKSKIIIDGTINKYNSEIFYIEGNSNLFLLSYGASRRMSKNQNLTSSITKYKTSLFDDEIELINAEEWFLQKYLKSFIAEENTKEKYLNEFELVKKLLKDILPDVNDIRIKPVNEENSKILLEVETNFGWVNLRDLSFGYQTITALLVDIAANMMEQYPESKNPLSEPVIILIDEIDLHLHPKWQRVVIDKLSYHFPKAQFIVTAHSPLIVQAAQDRNANIVVCRKEGNKVVIDNNPESVKGWRIDQILTSDLFEVESSQSVKMDEIRNEKINILLKDKLSLADKKRLNTLDEKLNDNPVYSTKESINAEELIKKAAELLKK